MISIYVHICICTSDERLPLKHYPQKAHIHLRNKKKEGNPFVGWSRLRRNLCNACDNVLNARACVRVTLWSVFAVVKVVLLNATYTYRTWHKYVHNDGGGKLTGVTVLRRRAAASSTGRAFVSRCVCVCVGYHH